MKIVEAIPASRRLEVIRDLDRTVSALREYVLLVFLSCVIATFGLVLNSGAVIIGAMLIAPLMSPILATALSLVRGDLRRLGRGVGMVLLGTILSMVLSALLGTLVSMGSLNFLEELPTEVTSRTQPTLFDLAVALAGGAAGAYALAQPNLSATLPGVAIATALLPPLCVTGIGVSQQRADVSTGSLLLFLANLAAILFAGSVVFTLSGFGPIAKIRREQVVPRAILLSSGLMLIVAVPLGGFMFQIARDAGENVAIRTTLMEELGKLNDGSRLVGFEKEWKTDHLEIEATVRSPDTVTRAEALGMQRRVASEVRKKVSLTLLIVPITLLEPVEPPPEGDGE